MPDPRIESEAAGERNALHNGIIHDDTPDQRYANGMSNLTKTRFVCKVMQYPEPGFDLDLPFPIEEWLASDDNAMICAGLYLSDLRMQFYSKRLGAAPERRESLWPRQAEAEFWQMQFNGLIFRRLNGSIVDDRRVLN